jgi:hypothetical protein
MLLCEADWVALGNAVQRHASTTYRTVSTSVNRHLDLVHDRPDESVRQWGKTLPATRQLPSASEVGAHVQLASAGLRAMDASSPAVHRSIVTRTSNHDCRELEGGVLRDSS